MLRLCRGLFYAPHEQRGVAVPSEAQYEYPLVSVIIPTHNRAALLREAIESVLSVDRHGFTLEILVVDDASTDNTPEVAAGFPVRYLHSTGVGAARARNVGIASARGDYIAFLDDDDLWLRNNIEPQLRLLKDRPELGAVYAQVLLTTPDRSPIGLPVPAGPLRSGWIHADLLTHLPQLGAVVVRRSAARATGPQDPSLLSDQDWDWLLRLARRYQIGFVEQPVSLFRQRGYDDEALAWRRFPNMLKVFRKHAARYGGVQRLRLVRVFWRHRGWYAGIFLAHAQHHAHCGQRARALRCTYYALRASPLHTARNLLRVTRAGACAAIQQRDQLINAALYRDKEGET